MYLISSTLFLHYSNFLQNLQYMLFPGFVIMLVGLKIKKTLYKIIQHELQLCTTRSYNQMIINSGVVFSTGHP